jgi:hypothetical protein
MLKKMLSYSTFPLLFLLLMPQRGATAQNVTGALAPGPDAIVGDLPSLIQAGNNGSQVGLMMATDICNNGNVQVNWFQLPETDHPVIPQNLYRMSGGPDNFQRFEQIGQSWVKHAIVPLQQNACGFGCIAASDSAHLGVGCSTADSASANALQSGLGSRAWLNPFTGIFPATANSHTGHTHDGTAHRILVNANDLSTTMNQGATYFAEAQVVTPHEYAWCQSHAGECNMFNNASYRQFLVAGTTSFSFSAVGSTTRMTPAINAWPGATILTIEPAPGVDGRAFLAYKVTGPVAGIYHYEYAIYNQNLDRGIQSFSVPRVLIPGLSSAELGEQNVEFHAPPQHPGFANDGTQGNAGYSSAEWTFNAGAASLTWSTETFAQNANANAIRWGTLYNFRFDINISPTASNATVGFFKTGSPIVVPIQGPRPVGGPSPTPEITPTPTTTPTLTPTPTPSSTPTTTPTATPTPTPTPTPSPSASPSSTPSAQPLNLSTRMRVQPGDNAAIGGFIITGSAPKYVLLRAIGPSLTGFGVPNALADPVMELHGPTGFITGNDNWRDSKEKEIKATGIPPTNDLESAIIRELDPGSYTAIVRGNGNSTGIALVELYDLNRGADSRLANLSTRALVGTGDNIVIAGFMLGGNSGNDRIVMRGIGPSLTPLGVPNALADPTLQLRDSNGVILDINNNWQDNAAQAAELTAAGLAPSNPLESGMATSLPPGLYTALLSGVNNGTGIGLVEIYDLH